ncbi:MAG: high-potential iron-sulfur protein [Chromatiaceae bacterium]|jgi:hypothetical protein
MSDKPIDPNRRQAIKLIAGGVAAIPLAGLMTSGTAAASELPHVTEDDPIAVGLQYKHDASQAPRTDKPGAPADTQHCGNCQLFGQGDGEWRACSIFPGKAVNANGWCTAWVMKVG